MHLDVLDRASNPKRPLAPSPNSLIETLFIMHIQKHFLGDLYSLVLHLRDNLICLSWPNRKSHFNEQPGDSLLERIAEKTNKVRGEGALSVQLEKRGRDQEVRVSRSEDRCTYWREGYGGRIPCQYKILQL